MQQVNVDEFVSTLDTILKEHNTSLEDLVIESIQTYGDFYSALAEADSMKDVDVIVRENPDGLRVNDNVQYMFELESKGLVQLFAQPERLKVLRHPLLKLVSAKRVQHMLDRDEMLGEDTHEAIASLVAVQAAKAVLGGIQYNVDYEWLAQRDVNLIHPQHEVVQ